MADELRERPDQETPACPPGAGDDPDASGPASAVPVTRIEMEAVVLGAPAGDESAARQEPVMEGSPDRGAGVGTDPEPDNDPESDPETGQELDLEAGWELGREPEPVAEPETEGDAAGAEAGPASEGVTETGIELAAGAETAAANGPVPETESEPETEPAPETSPEPVLDLGWTPAVGREASAEPEAPESADGLGESGAPLAGGDEFLSPFDLLASQALRSALDPVYSVPDAEPPESTPGETAEVGETAEADEAPELDGTAEAGHPAEPGESAEAEDTPWVPRLPEPEETAEVGGAVEAAHPAESDEPVDVDEAPETLQLDEARETDDASHPAQPGESAEAGETPWAPRLPELEEPAEVGGIVEAAHPAESDEPVEAEEAPAAREPYSEEQRSGPPEQLDEIAWPEVSGRSGGAEPSRPSSPAEESRPTPQRQWPHPREELADPGGPAWPEAPSVPEVSAPPEAPAEPGTPAQPEPSERPEAPSWRGTTGPHEARSWPGPQKTPKAPESIVLPPDPVAPDPVAPGPATPGSGAPGPAVSSLLGRLAEPPGNWDDPLSSIGDTGEYPTAEVGQAHVLPPVPKQQPPKRISILEAQGSTSNTEALALRPMLPPVAEPWAEPSTGEQAAVPAPGVKRHDTSPQPLKRSSRSDKRAGQDKPGLIGRLQSKKWLIPALIGAGVLVIGFIGVSAALAGKVPNGASVAGVRIGGLSRQEAIDLLDRELGPKSRETVKVLVGESEVTFDPVIAGMGFSPKETVAAVTGFSLNPLRLLKHIGGTGEVAPALVVDQAALEAHVGELAAQTRVEPVGGTVTVAGGSVATTSPVIGAGLDQTGAASQIKKNYLIEEAPWRLPVDELAPKIGQEQIDEAVAQIATPLLSGPVEVSAGRAKVDLPASEIAAAAVIEPNDESGDSLILSWDTELLRASVSKRLPKGTETDPQDAHFVFIGGQPAIEDGRQGVQVNADQLANAMTTAATAAGAERRVTAELAQSDPSADRAALEKLGVKEVIGRFETQATNSADRTRNLRKAADMVTGILVKPGETFSLDDALGHRSLETGWYNAGVVVDGVTQDGIGGGLSQFSTTLYNAGHLAGMVDVEHTPHANYFSRYPTGREATIWEGQIDNKFKNDTPYGVVLRAGVSESLKVWVELWSTKYWSVETGIGQGYSYVAPRVIESTTDSCIPQASGGSGFQVDYWRIKTGPDGKALDRENWHWRYDPMNAIVCKETDE